MSSFQGGIQLPDDVIPMGYIKTSEFNYAQVFYSPSLNFKGTEQEFIDSKLAYRYTQLDSCTRRVAHE